MSQLFDQATILVVDDNPTNVKVLCSLLSECNYRVSIAKSGESALKKVQRATPDLILLDVMMPGIDGFETCARLKANPKTQDIPVVLMTALSDSVNKVKGLSLGAVDYITKPVEHEEAIARIKNHLALRKAQIELVQKEKMAALGQLVAGVAHEINNPVGFIYGNLMPAKEYAETLLELIQLYEIHTDTPPEVQAYIDKMGISFIQQDFVSLLDSMSMGVERIQKIVQSLKTFSRLDESDYKAVDLHEGLESTLIILQSRLKGNESRDDIKVIKHYGKLPLIYCYANKLNQVFMNLLANAIDAIDEKFETLPLLQLADQQPTLQISTAIEHSANGNKVSISIVDNGLGISKEGQQKIFDQFFTTKPVGKGTGLGLSISREIIAQDHKGNLSVESQLGKGTKFMIVMPAETAEMEF